jgi:hypothetical protein
MSDDENEQVMESEYDAKNRTSSGDPLINALRSVRFKDKNPTEQFYELVNAVFYKLKESGISFISDLHFQDIIDGVAKINKPEYKNSTAYILGYYASGFGNGISDDNMNAVFRVLPQVNTLANEYPICRISKPDIIRYARMWRLIPK